MKNIKLTTIAMTVLMTFTMLSACNSAEELPEGAAVIAETDIGIIEAMQTEGKDELEIVETSVTYEDEVMATDETFGTPNDSSTDTTSGTTSSSPTDASATQSTVPTTGNTSRTNGTSAPNVTRTTPDPSSGTTTGAANFSKPTETTASPSETTATPTPKPTATPTPKPTATPTPKPTSTPTPTPSGVIDMSNAEKTDPNEQFYVLVGIDVEIWFEIDPDDDGVYEWTSEILHFETSEYKNPKSQDCVAKLEDMGYTVVGVGNIQIVKSYSEPA